jgi:hypothetical protein
MKNPVLAMIVIIALVAIGIAVYTSTRNHNRPLPVPALTQEQESATLAYDSPDYGLTFDYSAGYYLKERVEGVGNRPELVVVLVEDSVENRDVVEGRTTEGRDGPTSITIEVHPNPDRLNAEDWVRADTNWTVRTSEAAPYGRGQLTGITYSWDGLYPGKSVIVTRGTRAYVFSTTWLTPNDAIITEFDRVLESVRITEDAP